MEKRRTLRVYVEVREFWGNRIIKWEGSIDQFFCFYEDVLSKLG